MEGYTVFVFQEKYECSDPFNIIFLCGSHYRKNDMRDKRNILKEYIHQSIPNGRPVILEENFQFANTNTKYLSYDEIFLTGLAQIETLASLYANKIIIVHESISTATELGMFAIDPELAKKIVLLVPDTISVEENKISNFIRLAFRKETAPETKVHMIRYYPDVEVYRSSPDKSEYYSYFHENRIGTFLDQALRDFLTDEAANMTISFSKSRAPDPKCSPDTIYYHLSDKNDGIRVNIHINTLKVHLLALLGLEHVRKQLRVERELRDHVNFLCAEYKSILQNTINLLTGTDIGSIPVKVFLKGTHCSLNQAVGFYIYMLQATGMIGLIQAHAKKPTIRKIQFSTEINHYKESIGAMVFDAGTTEFGRLGI